MDYPWAAEDLDDCRPSYLTLPGWQEPIGSIKRYRDLPANARRYLAAIEDLTGAGIQLVSVGSERNATIFKGKF
jgi:adenylosuccinate synthase